MRAWLIRIGKITVQAVAVVGGIVALISFLFGDLGEILNRLEPYRIPIIAIGVVLLSIAYFSWLTWLYVREIWQGIRGWIRKRRYIRQLRLLAPTIARSKQVMHERFVRRISPCDEEGKAYLGRIIQMQDSLGEKLSNLSISYPVRPTYGVTVTESEKWATYLDMLLPLAVKGDIDEARMVLARLEEQERSEVRGTTVISNLWKAFRAMW